MPWTADHGYEIRIKIMKGTSVGSENLGFQSESTMKSLDAPEFVNKFGRTEDDQKEYTPIRFIPTPPG